jgi:hypothetical protein
MHLRRKGCSINKIEIRGIHVLFFYSSSVRLVRLCIADSKSKFSSVKTQTLQMKKMRFPRTRTVLSNMQYASVDGGAFSY